jgi:hypothetical protein
MASTLVIACGAIANELMAVIRANGWSHINVQCLPASWHNSPERIAPGVERKILDNRHNYQRILVAYGDCGTGGQLDAILERYSVERLTGAHCYSFFAGDDVFTDLAASELGTFYLTDYLAANFDRLILDELGIKQHPELCGMYFGNYTRVLYLAQAHDEHCIAAAEKAAASIGLPLDIHFTGLQPLQYSLERIQINHV